MAAGMWRTTPPAPEAAAAAAKKRALVVLPLMIAASHAMELGRRLAKASIRAAVAFSLGNLFATACGGGGGKANAEDQDISGLVSQIADLTTALASTEAAVAALQGEVSDIKCVLTYLEDVDNTTGGLNEVHIVNANNAILGQYSKAIGHRVPPLRTSGHELIDPGRSVRGFQRTEGVEQTFVQHQYHMQVGQRRTKTPKGPPHQWQTLQQKKLLRHGLRHARPRTACNNNQVTLHARAAAYRWATASQSMTLKNAAM